MLSEDELLGLMPSGHEPGVPGPSRGTASLAVGRTSAGVVVSLPLEPTQGRHFAIVGESGMGKSSLLVALACRAAREGSVLLLDPLGETAALARAALAGEGLPVRYLVAGEADLEGNALEGIGASLDAEPLRAERALEDLTHALRRVRAGRFVDTPYWGPRLEEILLRALRAAATLPGGTLEDAHALLEGANQGRTVVPPPAREEVRQLLARVRERPDDGEGARRLLHEVVRNPALRRALCSRHPTLSLGNLVEEPGVTIVSGAAAALGEGTARYLLSVLLALVWSALLGRPTAGKTFVLLDEVQWYAHESLAEMLRLARRRNVHVGLVTQALGSLPDGVQEALRTNVADLLVFRGAPDDAREVARAVPSVTAEGVLSLPRGEAVALIGKGESVRWVRAARRPETSSGEPRGPVREASAAGHPTASRWPEAAMTAGLPVLPAGAEAALEGLRARAAALPGPGLVPLRPAELLRAGTLDARSLRGLGGALGRLGAIVRRERSDGETVWWVDPARLRARAPEERTGRGGPVPADTKVL